jgi:electron transport complex protein RnfD
MSDAKKLIVSHAPFVHDGTSVTQRSCHVMLALIPAALAGITRWGVPALGVLALAVSTAMLWELAFNKVSRRPVAIGDGNAAMVGMLLALMLPATAPWWLVVTGTFVAMVIGKEIFGGIGANPFNPVAVSIAILGISWARYLDFDAMLLSYDPGFTMIEPLTAAKAFGTSAAARFDVLDLLMGRQAGAIGAPFGLWLILGGLYLMVSGVVRWQIPGAFLAAVLITAAAFHLAAPERFAGPLFHLLTGYTLIGAFFLATEDSTSPVNFWPMLIFGAAGGLMTVLIRNIGVYPDGVIYAILVINLINPLVDKIRPRALGKVT